MGSSNENPKKIKVVYGGFKPTENIKDIDMPPEKAKKKEIAQKGKEMPEGEMVINIGYFKAEKDENGKHINVRKLSKEEMEQTADIDR